MKLQYASFLIPLHAGSQEQEEMNRFIRGRRVIQARKEMAVLGAILIEYLNYYDSIFDRNLIHDTYACRKGKGTKKAVLRAFHFAKSYAPPSSCLRRNHQDVSLPIAI